MKMLNAPVLTCHRGDNDSLMAEVTRLYFQPGMRIADVTFGQGIWWRQIDLSKYDFWPSDLLTVPDRRWDCRHLPYHSGDFDIHVLDLPYIPGFRGDAGRVHNVDYKVETTHNFAYADIIQLIRGGMQEGHRILKRGGLMLVKCQDMVDQFSKQRMAHIDVHNIAVFELGMEIQDLFLLVQQSPFLWVGRSNRFAKKNHSYLWIFKK